MICLVSMFRGSARAAARGVWGALAGLAIVAATSASAQDFQGRPELQQLREELAQEHGYEPAQFDRVFAEVKRLERVITLMDAPRRAPVPWPLYLERHTGGDRLSQGRAFMQAHQAALAQAERAYGVPPSVIAAIIGVETSYGRITGNFRVVDALATLAFDYPRRAEFFRGELKAVLLLARELQRSPLALRGSFAGAMGWPQFMPSSYRRWGVDFDNDQRIDLWDSPADIVGSVASFLGGHGWQRGGEVMTAIQPPPQAVLDTIDGGLSPQRTVGEWRAAGVRLPQSVAAMPDDAKAGIIALDRADGGNAYWMVFDNFYVIMRYNRSRMYASAVWSLARLLQGENSGVSARDVVVQP